MPRPEELGVPSNWGRWGTDDERGTANLLRADIVQGAAAKIQRGEVYSLAAPVSPEGPSLPSRRPMWHVATSRLRAAPETSSADDVIMMHTHGTTHVDALCHIFVGDTFYNGHPSSALQPTGTQRCGIENAGPMVSRGVMLDIAAFRGVPHLGDGEAIEPDELDACAAQQGVELRAGDVLLVRTGWWQLFGQGAEGRARFYATEPGLSGACGRWVKDHDFVALGADNPAVEVVRKWGDPLPLHRDVIWGCGGYLLEFLDLEQLGADKVYEFLYVASPLRIEGGVGSPIAPVAIA